MGVMDLSPRGDWGGECTWQSSLSPWQGSRKLKEACAPQDCRTLDSEGWWELTLLPAVLWPVSSAGRWCAMPSTNGSLVLDVLADRRLHPRLRRPSSADPASGTLRASVDVGVCVACGIPPASPAGSLYALLPPPQHQDPTFFPEGLCLAQRVSQD